jgi:PAS domain S-box-containing protein
MGVLEEVRHRVRGLARSLFAKLEAPDSPNPSVARRESAILAVSLDAIVAMDHRGLITEFNPAAERMFGYSHDTAIGRPLVDLIIPHALRDAHRRGLARYHATGEGPLLGRRIELNAIRANGSEFPVEVAICQIPSTDPPVFFGFIRDLTESKRAAEALRLAEERSRRLEAEAAARAERERAEAQTRAAEQLHARLITMLEATPDFVGFADARTAQVRWVNRAGRRMCGVSDEEDVTKLRISDFHPEQANRMLIEEALPAAARDGYWSGEMLFRHRDGSEIPTLMALMAHRDLAGHLESFSTISRNISEQRKAAEVERQLSREQLARAIAEEAVRVRDDFVAVAGHELKTPLSALLMQLEGIRRAKRSGRSVSYEDRFEKIARSADRLHKLINQLLDVSRISAGRLKLEPERFDLVALIHELVSRFADASPQAGANISVGGADSIEGEWDRLRVEQILTNLLSNALKYGEGRPVEIEARIREGQAVVQVTDHGIGIDPRHQEKIFQRFERAVAAREYGGFGLGLWISRRFVEALHGSIRVQSRPGAGSTFTILLPLIPEERPHA